MTKPAAGYVISAFILLNMAILITAQTNDTTTASTINVTTTATAFTSTFTSFNFTNYTNSTNVTAQCSPLTQLLANVTSRIFTSTSYPSNYSSNESCIWELTAPTGYAVEIIISSLTIDQGGGDYYEIYDGTGATANLVTKINAQYAEIKIVSKSNSLTFRFKSDNQTEGTGFSVSYRQVTGTGLLSGYFLYLNKPLWPTTLGETSILTVQAPVGNIFFIGLYITRSNIENCAHIRISSHTSNLYDLIGGNRDHAFQTSKNNFTVNIDTTTCAVPKINRGFKLTFLEQASPFPLCNNVQTTISGPTNGVLQIPPTNAAGFYNPKDNCSWTITVATGYSISLTLVSTIMPFTLSSITSNTPPDILYIYDGPNMMSREIFRTNASYSTANIVTTSNAVTLYFSANNDMIIGTGFIVAYQQVNSSEVYYGYVKADVDPSANQYLPNQDYGWTLTTSPGQNIEFFVDNRGLQCCDYVDLYDGDLTELPRPTQIVKINQASPLSYRGVTFSTSLAANVFMDSSVQSNGWTVYFNETPCCLSACDTNSSLSVDISVNNFTSSNYPYNYYNNESCGWLLTALPGHSIEIVISTLTFDQNGGDYYEVYEGDGTSSSLILQTRGQNSQIKLVSRTNELFFYFKSDTFKVGKGFNVTYRQVVANTLISGYIQTLNYNQSSIIAYDQIVSSFYALPGNIFLLGLYIDRENEVGCLNMKIWSGSQAVYNAVNGPRDYAFQTTYDNFSVAFAGPCAKPVFTTGFQLTFLEHTQPLLVCAGLQQTLSPSANGTLQIPPLNPAGFYNRQDNCSWVIEADAGSSISLTIVSTIMPYSQVGTTLTPSDSLYIYDGPNMESRQILWMNASYTTTNIVTTSNYTVLLFSANDDTSVGTGFLVTYQQVPLVSSFSGFIRSDVENSTGNYRANQDCGWILTTDPGRTIKFAVANSGTEVCCDYINLYDGDPNATQALIVQVKGSPVAIPGQTSTTSLTTYFFVDDYVDDKGWIITFSETPCCLFGCDSNTSLAVTSSVNNFTSTNFPFYYIINENCGWLLTASEGFAIEVIISTLSFDQGGGDYYAFYDGNETSNNLVIQTKVHYSEIKIISRSNQAFIYFQSDNVKVGKGFIATYRQVNATGLISGYVKNRNFLRFALTASENNHRWTLHALPGNIFQCGLYTDRTNGAFCGAVYATSSLGNQIRNMHNSWTAHRDYAFETAYNEITVNHDSPCQYPGTSTGFKMTFLEKINATSGLCSGSVTVVNGSASGTLQVPELNSAGFYNPLDNCSYLIMVDPGYSINLTLVSTNMPNDQNWFWTLLDYGQSDTLVIYDGTDTQSRKIFKYDAPYSTVNIVTTSNSALLSFSANSDIDVGTGFVVKYEQVMATTNFYGSIQPVYDPITGKYPTPHNGMWQVFTSSKQKIEYSLFVQGLGQFDSVNLMDIGPWWITRWQNFWNYQTTPYTPTFTHDWTRYSALAVAFQANSGSTNGWIIYFNETAYCSQGCDSGICISTDVCSCYAGWTELNCTIAICDATPCLNGGSCIGPNNCTCTPQWTDSNCSTPICANPVCLNGGLCVEPDVCNCTSSWTGLNCTIPTCLNNQCLYGDCTAPDVCTCWWSNFTGPSCSTPVCSPSCMNGGNCTAPDVCSCAIGWTGPTCQTAICNGTCLNGGNCTAPDFCTCATGWNGVFCESPICTPICVNGNCTAPNTCICESGWTGLYCQDAICSNACVNGLCSAPEICSCNAGWTGSTCESPVCNSSCINGNCTAPDFCLCNTGWNGTVCETAICNGGCHNGNCTDPDVCVCEVGWTGANCDSAICIPSCSVNGNCTAPNTCSCLANWNGTLCTLPICLSGCGNGNCTGPGSCTCDSGWTGSACDIAICSQTCANNGNCTAPNVCTCTLGWTGSDCNSAICSSTCLNGNCTAPELCTCNSGWSGAVCDTAICNGGCLNGNCTGPNVCTCDVGWTGANCDSSICIPSCSVNGNCTAPNICSCLAGWNGTLCSLAICSNGCGNGNCTSPETCTCDSGWTGSACDTPLCSLTCANNGNCTAPNVCTCTLGWTGNSCSSAICSSPCLNGNCTAPDFCTCSSGWNGTSCETAICPGGCFNGNCTGPNICTCSLGWSGSSCNTATCIPACSVNGNCTSPNTCSCSTGWNDSTCGTPICASSCGHGNCSSPNTCTCNSGWTGSNCSTPFCSQTCANNGTCVAPDTCSCSSGWTGSNCSQAICSAGCSHGSCISPEVCQCNTGWTGFNCSTAICSQNCANGGFCVAPDTCSCAVGWTGFNCTTAICSPVCQNGGTCATPNNCVCATGYNGTSCQFAICNNPCLNGGLCSAPDVCSCTSGWNGIICDIPVCNQGCANGGNCTAPSMCSCTANWTGSGCTTPVCNPSCQNGGTCTSPNNCTCTSGTNGTICENLLCNPMCKNGGTCNGIDVCVCGSGWSGAICETLLSGVSALSGVSNISAADFVSGLGSITEAVQAIQQGTLAIERNLTIQEIKAMVSDVTSPDKIATLVKQIIANPFFDPPVEIFSDDILDEQSEVLSTLNDVTQRMLQLADSLTLDQLSNLTAVLARAADRAANLAVKGALAVQSAIIKSDRLTVKPQLSCKPLIAEKERSSLKEASTIGKLDTLNGNFGDFIDGLIQATFHAPPNLGESKIISGDFYSVTVHKTTLHGLSGLTLHSNLGGIDFPYFEDKGRADFVVYKQSASSFPKLKPSTTALLVLTTYVSNVMNSSSPYNFPTVTVRLFTSLGYELEWVSTIPLQITSIPPDSYRRQYNTEKMQSQCDPHNIQCDVTSNADVLAELATFPLPTNAGDFFVDISGNQTIPYEVFISFNEIPTHSKHFWAISIANFRFVTNGNNSLHSLRVTYDSSGRLRVIIPQEVITFVSGQPVTRVIDPSPPFFVYFLIKRNFAAFSKVEDLPHCACEHLSCEGYNLRINRVEPTRYYRRRRQAEDYQINDLELEANSTNMAITFRATSFGTFTSDLLIAPNTIEFTDVSDNFDSLVADNWIVLATLSVLLGLFLMILIPLLHLDKEDLQEWAFLPITSNSPHEKMRYLISVHCNGSKNYKLTPRVDIRLFGEVTSTEWRWLTDGKRRNFTSARPSNFILTTYHSIGLVEKLEISVTSETLSEKVDEPLELDIDRIIVVDVAKGRKYVFPVRSKLGNRKQTKMFKLPTEDELKCFDYLLLKNYQHLINDAHIWRSIFRRPIASNWTRAERLACLFVALYMAMLSNAMFFGKEPSSPRTGLNVGGVFRLSWFTFVTSLISCSIVVPPTCLIAILFQFVKRRSAEKSEWDTIFKINVENADEDDNDANVTTKNKKRFQLPHWCLYIGWSLVGICIAASFIFITFYSLQWGKEKSLQWLSSLFIELLQDLIFIQTAKVFVFAVFRAGRLTLPEDGMGVGKLTFAKENATKRLGMFKKLRAIATGLGHHAAYVVAFAMVISATTNPYAYNQVKSLKPHLFVDNFKPVTDTVNDHVVIFDHLLFKIIPNFLNGNQVKYGLTFEDFDFYIVPNHDVVIIGPIRVRQIRTGPNSCPIQNPVAPTYTGKYIIPLANNTFCSKAAQGFDVLGDIFDRRSFNASWNSPVDKIDTTNMTEFQEAWLYRETNAQPYIGELDTHGTFGYYVDLPSKLKSALRVMAQLRLMRWLDGNTTAVFTDFNLYNPQTNVFSVIKIVFESYAAGGMLYQVRRYPLKLYQYSGTGAMFTIIVQAVWIALLISQIVKLIYQIKKEGLKKFRSNQWNYLCVINLSVGVIIVCLFSARVYVTNTVMENLLNPDQFTSLDALSSWEELTFGLYGLGFFLAVMGFFQYLETNKYWAVVLATLSKGKSEMFSFCIFYFSMSGIFAGFMYLLVGPVMPAFSSFKQAISTLFQRMIGWPAMTKLGFPDTFSMLCSMMYSGSILLLGGQVFIIIITVIYDRISKNVETETDWDAEFVNYLDNELQRITEPQPGDKDTPEKDGEEEEKKSEDVILKPVEGKTFQKFDAMMLRFSKFVEKFGLEEDVLHESKPTVYERAQKTRKESIPQLFGTDLAVTETVVPTIPLKAAEIKSKNLIDPQTETQKTFIEPKDEQFRKMFETKKDPVNNPIMPANEPVKKLKSTGPIKQQSIKKAEVKQEFYDSSPKKKILESVVLDNFESIDDEDNSALPVNAIADEVDEHAEDVDEESVPSSLFRSGAKSSRVAIKMKNATRDQDFEDDDEDYTDGHMIGWVGEVQVPVKTASAIRKSYMAHFTEGSSEPISINIIDRSGVGISPPNSAGIHHDPASRTSSLLRRTSSINSTSQQLRPVHREDHQ